MTATLTPDAATTGGPAPAARPRRGLNGVLIAVISVALLAAGGGLAVALGIGRTESPAVDSVDAGFARDMSQHHLQAVEMANLAATRSQDAEVQRLAFDISATQTNQVGRMQGWLTLWALPLTDGDLMAWMSDAEMSDVEMSDGEMDHGATAGHDMPSTAADGAVMPGMATETELTELRSLSGTAFDVMFLQLMIRHHQGGLEMAQYGEAHAEQPAVRRLAASIVTAQSTETATMETMLTDRGGTPLPAA